MRNWPPTLTLHHQYYNEQWLRDSTNPHYCNCRISVMTTWLVCFYAASWADCCDVVLCTYITESSARLLYGTACDWTCSVELADPGCLSAAATHWDVSCTRMELALVLLHSGLLLSHTLYSSQLFHWFAKQSVFVIVSEFFLLLFDILCCGFNACG